jgi:hypothetical protein
MVGHGRVNPTDTRTSSDGTVVSAALANIKEADWRDTLTPNDFVRGVRFELLLREDTWGGAKWGELAEGAAGGGDDVFLTSSRVGPGNAIHAFIGYVWTSPPKHKVGVVKIMVNLGPAIVACATFAVFGTLLLFAILGKDARLPACFVAFAATVLFSAVLHLGADGVPGLWLLVNNSANRRRSNWLDRFCIHQGDSELKKLGLARFEKVLQRSHNMWILLSDDYLTRIWCAYELATFTGTHGAEGVTLLDLGFLYKAYLGLMIFLPTFIGGFGSYWLYVFFNTLQVAETPTSQYAAFVIFALFWFALMALGVKFLTKVKSRQFAATARNSTFAGAKPPWRLTSSTFSARLDATGSPTSKPTTASQSSTSSCRATCARCLSKATITSSWLSSKC